MRKIPLLLCSAIVVSMLSACQMFPAEEELPAAPLIRSYETTEYKQALVIRGDLEKTVNELCGYSADTLQLLQSREGELKRIDWVWTCAGEGGDQVGRAMVLDDGSYHYCLTAMADADVVGTLEDQWNRVFTSFAIS